MFYTLAKRLHEQAELAFHGALVEALLALAVYFRQADQVTVSDWRALAQREESPESANMREAVARLAAAPGTRALLEDVRGLSERGVESGQEWTSSPLRRRVLEGAARIVGGTPIMPTGPKARARYCLGHALLVAYLLDLRQCGEASMSDEEERLFAETFAALAARGDQTVDAAARIWWATKKAAFPRRRDPAAAA